MVKYVYSTGYSEMIFNLKQTWVVIDWVGSALIGFDWL